MIFPRRTVSEIVEIDGLGLHSGVPVEVRIHPGEEGIAFRHGTTRILATPDQVTDTQRCTQLGEVSTIEHLMSALAGLEITDAEIELSAPELPALDGSALPYFEAMSGRTTDFGERELRNPFSRVFVQETDAKMAISNGNGHWRYTFETAPRWPGTQVYETEAVHEDYAVHISPARTFGFAAEIPVLIDMGFARGLNLETALVIGEEGYQNFALFPDEPARHKLLDAIGDLYLAGVPPRFLNVAAERTGHRANVKAALNLWKAVQP